ncbi:MAG: D-glycero-beta-D-manno-heptose 1-phosphate adenylyltransferase [Elusimicrobiaceae bacterium]|nr:D-glycero-beta-D-manno-heptose 1-phosphate adenylyltransferase [Elusimicrobiaceae bacterium]
MKAKNKIMTRAKLSAFVKKAKKEGKKIVFTNGCFDILHAGHVSSIEFAKSKGDILVLGLNSDASVKRLKGPKRPINKQADRALVVASLGAVDAVCLFSQDTPLELIKLVRPDVLVKGADYKNKEVVGEQFAGRVVLFPLVKGRSTTNLINKISLQ